MATTLETVANRGLPAVPSEPVAVEEVTLTPQEKRIYGRLAEDMTFYHDRFRKHFDEIYKFCDKPERLAMTIKAFLRYAESLNSHLTMHHNIEETYIFPVLAKKMPEFKNEHKDEHKKIHKGLHDYEAYIKSVEKKDQQYNPADFRAIMDSFKEVLFYHLDAEIHSLRAENMKKYWTPKEMAAIPI